MQGRTAKILFGIAAVLGLTLGVGAGVFADGSRSSKTMVEVGLAIWVVCHLLFGLWVRSRAKPGSGDRIILPTLIPFSVGMLMNILPRLFWPDAERVHIAASIASIGLIAVAFVRQMRRRRQFQTLRDKKGQP